MKMLPFLFFATTILCACKKEKVATPETKPETISFLNKKTDDFDGEFNGKKYSWEITNAWGFITFDMRYMQQGHKTNGKSQTHFFGFYAHGCDAKAEIYTPYYDDPSTLFGEILTVGKKKVGAADDAFKFEITIPIGHLQTYNCMGNHNSNGDQSDSYLEILKTESGTDIATGKPFKRAWMKFSVKLYNETTGSIVNFTYGTLVARFLE